MGSVTLMFALVVLCLGTLHAYDVAFSAAKSGYQGRGRIVYNVQHLDNGYGYNSHTGIFRAPSSGLYSFTYNFATYPKYSVSVYLYKNGHIKSRSYAYNRYGYANGGNTVNLELHRGDKVWTYCASGYVYGNYYTTFNGVKISSYWNKDNAEQDTTGLDQQAEQEDEFASDQIDDLVEN